MVLFQTEGIHFPEGLKAKPRWFNGMQIRNGGCLGMPLVAVPVMRVWSALEAGCVVEVELGFSRVASHQGCEIQADVHGE